MKKLILKYQKEIKYYGEIVIIYYNFIHNKFVIFIKLLYSKKDMKNKLLKYFYK